MAFSTDEKFALQLDAEDPLRPFREKFHLPLGKDGKPLIYLAGNSLGLMPKSARELVDQELDDWAKLAVDAHMGAKTPWYPYHETVREPAARLAGAQPNEIICMNSLTVNLHLMMATFYRPTKTRFKILMEEPAFPSDTYAIKTQIVHHGFDSKEALVLARPRDGEFTIRQDDIEDVLEKQGDEIALVLMAGVNFFTGQLFDIEKITAAAQKRGCVVGIDLAHAIGNVPLALHDWNVDFAVWCSYKYLNAVPVRWPARSCTSGTRRTASCRAWPVGLGTIRTRGSACISNRSSSPFRLPMDGRSAIRPSSPWRPCALRSRSSMKPAGWKRCGRNRSS